MSAFEKVRKKRGWSGKLASNQVLVNVDSLPSAKDSIDLNLRSPQYDPNGPQLVFKHGRWLVAGGDPSGDKLQRIEKLGAVLSQENADLRKRMHSLEQENIHLRSRESRLLELMTLQRLDYEKQLQKLGVPNRP